MPLDIRETMRQTEDRKVVVTAAASADFEVCVRGKVVAIQVPEGWMPRHA